MVIVSLPESNPLDPPPSEQLIQKMAKLRWQEEEIRAAFFAAYPPHGASLRFVEGAPTGCVLSSPTLVLVDVRPMDSSPCLRLNRDRKGAGAYHEHRRIVAQFDSARRDAHGKARIVGVHPCVMEPFGPEQAKLSTENADDTHQESMFVSAWLHLQLLRMHSQYHCPIVSPRQVCSDAVIEAGANL